MSLLAAHFKAFFLALQFLTRLPSPAVHQVSKEDSARSSLYFLPIGLLLGALLWLSSQLVVMTSWSLALQAGILLVLWVWLTGALHLDGAADMADAWLGAKHNRDKALAIMQDSRIGTGGAVALTLLLLLKWQLLIEILQQDGALALLWLPVLARAGAIALMLTTAYQRANGIAASMLSARVKPFLWGQLAILLLWSAWYSWPLFVGGLLAFLAFRQASKTLTGGMTGDTAGAMIEWLEVSLLLILLLSL